MTYILAILLIVSITENVIQRRKNWIYATMLKDRVGATVKINKLWTKKTRIVINDRTRLN